jgi:hypothetical protein
MEGYDVLLAPNRFCLNVGRAHRRQNVFLRINLVAGTVTQRCFDADCRHFESERFMLPPFCTDAPDERAFWVAFCAAESALG